MSDELSAEDLAEVKQVLKSLLAEVLKEVPEMVELIGVVHNDSIDVKTVMTAIAGASGHSDSDEILRSAKGSYDSLFDSIFECVQALKTTIKCAEQTNEYIEKITKLIPKDRADELNELAANVLGIAEGQDTTRPLSWSAGLVNLFASVRGLDRAQAAILQKQPRSERQAFAFKKIFKAGLGDGLSAALPVYGTLIAIAETQTPEVDKQIDSLSKAIGTFAAILKFREIATKQKLAADQGRKMFDDASAAEIRAVAEIDQLTRAFHSRE